MTRRATPEPSSAAGSDAGTTAAEAEAGSATPGLSDGPRAPWSWLRSPRAWLRQMWKHLLAQHTTTLKLALAVGIGILIGNLPFYGFHLPICIGVAWLLGLNQVTTYLAANISNPIIAPFLAFAAIQVGQRILVGTWLPLSVAEIHARGAVVFFEAWLLGAVIVGGVLGFIGSGLTYGIVDWFRVHRSPLEKTFKWVVQRYRDNGAETAFVRFVSGKLRRDPVFRHLPEHLPEKGSVLDLGAGRCQLALMLHHLRPGRQVCSIDWDADKVETGRAAANGLDALTFQVGDAREAVLSEADHVVILDLLHYFPGKEQDRILERAAAAVRPGGRLLVREADADGGFRFKLTAMFERWSVSAGVTKAPGLCFRPAAELQQVMERVGLKTEIHPMAMGTPLANVLLVGAKADGAEADGAEAHGAKTDGGQPAV